MKFTLKIVSVLIFTSTIFINFKFGGLSLFQGYNIFDPYIDTEFAPDYTPEKFEKIKIGQSKQDVIKTIGVPLFYNYEDCEYDYTNDGFLEKKSSKNFSINDFAWYESKVIFGKDEKVVEIHKGWKYD